MTHFFPYFFYYKEWNYRCRDRKKALTKNTINQKSLPLLIALNSFFDIPLEPFLQKVLKSLQKMKIPKKGGKITYYTPGRTLGTFLGIHVLYSHKIQYEYFILKLL